MPKLIESPLVVQASGNKPKIIEEFVGRVNTNTDEISIAKMTSPTGWIEPGQMPEFDEFTIVLRGLLRVNTNDGSIDVSAGQAILVEKEEWVRYSKPSDEGCEYIAICVPAFSPDTVRRDE